MKVSWGDWDILLTIWFTFFSHDVYIIWAETIVVSTRLKVVVVMWFIHLFLQCWAKKKEKRKLNQNKYHTCLCTHSSYIETLILNWNFSFVKNLLYFSFLFLILIIQIFCFNFKKKFFLVFLKIIMNINYNFALSSPTFKSHPSVFTLLFF